jgi:hypothetical protein
MFFASTQPSDRIDAGSAYLSARTSRLEPWPLAQHIDLGRQVQSLALLADKRTLLVGTENPAEIIEARRATDSAGDRDFELAEVLSFEEPGYDLRGLSLSCDGWHLLYTRQARDEPDAPTIARAVPVFGTNPLRLGTPFDLPGLPRGSMLRAGAITELREGPFCEHLYFGLGNSAHFALARTNP